MIGLLLGNVELHACTRVQSGTPISKITMPYCLVLKGLQANAKICTPTGVLKSTASLAGADQVDSIVQ